MSDLNANCELRIANLKHPFGCLMLLVALCVFAGNSFAQDEPVTQAQIDWIAEEGFLQRTIQTGNVEQKRDALLRIRNLKSEKASRLAVRALTDKSEIVRATAAFSVVFLPQEEAAGVLLPLLQDESAFVRRETAYALGKIRDINAVNPLLQNLQNDKVLEVRAASAIALGAIGDVAAIGELVKILQRKPKAEEEFLRRSAARSVGQIAQIIQTSEVEVLTPENFLPDKYNPVEKNKYPDLIERFPDFRAANNVLIEALQNAREFDDVKREAAFALGAIGDKSALPILQANLNAKDYYLAEICRQAQRKIQFNKNAGSAENLKATQR